jgi:hypothetical protein
MDDTLAQIYQHLRDDRQHRLDNQPQIDASLVNDYLEMIKLHAANKVGKEQYFLLKRSYAEYALMNADEHSRLVGIVMGQQEEDSKKEEVFEREL